MVLEINSISVFLLQGSSEGSELTVYGEAQAVRCREALSHMQLDRYSQPGCVKLTSLFASLQASFDAWLNTH